MGALWQQTEDEHNVYRQPRLKQMIININDFIISKKLNEMFLWIWMFANISYQE